ncbi:armadillo-type protein [Cercophora scortea]|uniref:Armadillo-type protein n=1 Tax=Cercophora scortea TaxID=314031 RepID=A0AAE0MJW2_9PEZI|nr:armadillo-type protein [Cercophora scortea]
MMSSVADLNGLPRNNPHQRSKSSVLRSLMGHRRNNSDGSVLPSSFSTPSEQPIRDPANEIGIYRLDTAMGPPGLPRLQTALGELPQNQQEPAQRSPDRSRAREPPSPTKSTFATISLKSLGLKDSSSTKQAKPPKESSPTKPKKVKSVTNFGALLSRPKSSKNLEQMATEDEARRAKEKDKENRTPPSSLAANDNAPPPPIYAQFVNPSFSDQLLSVPSPSASISASGNSFGRPSRDGTPERPSLKPRPKSFQYYASSQEKAAQAAAGSQDPRNGADDKSQKRLTWGRGMSSRPGLRHALSGLGLRAKSSTSVATEFSMDPQDIATHLEAMLDRRNIPENQRYKMRNLNDTIKMEFIRQDWAETQMKPPESPTTSEGGGFPNADQGGGSSSKKKHGRGKSLTTLGRSSKDKDKAGSAAPSKKKGDSSLGRHFRTRSTDSIASERSASSGTVSGVGGLVAKVKGHHSPGDFVAYMRKVQKPELVEVGKLHKLRLLLRNETVAWTDDFIRQGGMKEIVELLHRIMAVEWREEHEDALLHENLLCLKALCTTALALHYLHSIHTTLFPALLHMLFDPEKKGPSEFTTRGIITSLLLTYIECAAPQERVSRAQTVLRYLRDPEPKEEERPVDFVLDMRRERPYRVWCKEVVSVTKEVFWIFLHNLNIVALPSDRPSPTTTSSTAGQPNMGPLANGTRGLSPSTTDQDKGTGISDPQLSYMALHFPQERPPVPAAPYVGGVEWDATNYLASHLDLLNAILACTGPAPHDRNALRAELRISGWERCLGGSLRLCKEKFYGSVHDGLRTWVAAAADDGWDVRDVRFGPPPESRSCSPAKRAGGARKPKEEAPQIEMPRLDFGLDAAGGGGGRSSLKKVRADDHWLS